MEEQKQITIKPLTPKQSKTFLEYLTRLSDADLAYLKMVAIDQLVQMRHGIDQGPKI